MLHILKYLVQGGTAVLIHFAHILRKQKPNCTINIKVEVNGNTIEFLDKGTINQDNFNRTIKSDKDI